ncbi:MAG TPA: ATP-binding protein [Candidatus Limnocylindria bacterium]|nr:ATP-binding protein [Candidatus Limnocylindria bacterium]
MRRRSITGRLTAYFALVLGVFALVMGALFAALFRDYTLRLHMDTLQAQARQMASGLSNYGGRMGMGRGMSIGSALRLVSESAGTDVWLVDGDLNLVSLGRMQQTAAYSRMPEGSRELIAEVFAGKTTVSRAFSGLLEQPTLTVATPVTDAQGTVTLALLLHSAVEGADRGVMEGQRLLAWAALLGLALSALAAALLARGFIRPIAEMQVAANHMAEGDYDTPVPAARRDELGALASDLNRLAGSLRDARDGARLEEERRRDFMANVSHELRTPVTVLLSSLEAIRDGVVQGPDELANYHAAMLAETRHLQRMIADLLELSRLQSPDFTLRSEPVDVPALLGEAARAAEALGEHKGVKVLADAPPDATLTGDPTRLRQALMTLLDNAVRHSPQGGTVTLRARRTPAGLTVAVEDEGPGIPDAAMPHIFERFFSQRAPGEEAAGTGLGLPIAREIAGRHGAALTAENRPEGGAAFTLLFPTNGTADGTPA